MHTLDLTTDIIDVRDIIERIETLEGLLGNEEGTDEEWHDLEIRVRELATLHALMTNLLGYGGDEQWRGDWYPVTLIKDSYFVEYTKDLIEDCYSDINTKSMDWPYRHMSLDFDACADELKNDYANLTIGDSDYWYR